MFEKTDSIGETQDCCDEVVFKMFSVHKNRNAGVFKFLLFESVYEKVLFHDGLVWTVGLTVEIKLPFPNSPAYLVCRLNFFKSNRNEFTKTERDYCILPGVLNSHARLNLRAFLFFEFLTGFSYGIHAWT